MATSLFMEALSGRTTERPPLWMMRQAGRYLPEYRELRATASGFLDFCYSPKLATEATLQPIRRFGFDAAILFSDILVVPHALGQDVSFVEGEGPRLAPITNGGQLASLSAPERLERLDAVIETVSSVRGALGPETALIGFCGAPWTVASYMIAGKGTPDQAPARLVAYRDPQFLQAMIDLLVEASTGYLIRQIDAGADAIQIFESFAGALPPPLFRRWSLDPIAAIARKVRAARPKAKIIVFARGAGFSLPTLVAEEIADGIGLDWAVDIGWARAALSGAPALQGNLDPLALIAGGDALRAGVERIRTAMAGRPHIFNLGHGIQPETPIAHVEELVRLVRA